MSAIVFAVGQVAVVEVRSTIGRTVESYAGAYCQER